MTASPAICLKSPSGDLDLIIQLAVEDRVLTTRIGAPGQPSIVIRQEGRNAYLLSYVQYIEKNLRYYRYLECDFPETTEDGSFGTIIWTNQTPDNPLFKTVSEEVVRCKGHERTWPLLHFAEGLAYDGDFDFGLLGLASGAAGLIIEGPVDVNGILYLTGETGPGLVFIKGDVTAKSLINSDSTTQIDGDLTVTQTVLGTYNDGELYIFGTVSAEALVADDQTVYAKHYNCQRLLQLPSPQDFDWLDPALIVHYDGIPDYVDGGGIWARIQAGESILARANT